MFFDRLALQSAANVSQGAGIDDAAGSEIIKTAEGLHVGIFPHHLDDFDVACLVHVLQQQQSNDDAGVVAGTSGFAEVPTVGLFKTIPRDQGSDFQPAVLFINFPTEGKEFSEEKCGSAIFGFKGKSFGSSASILGIINVKPCTF